ncbi:MAG TPA: adenine phosphoribosyltransferase [Verrucomicrobiales bacterium]|nr:adenine phosphoribosyltransferase [Verrucomicrobiales bacterium]
MSRLDLQRLHDAVRDVSDFPQPGIVFKDITPILADPALLRLSLDALGEIARDLHPSKIVGIDARGFIFGAALADRLACGFIPMRKKGKLPYHTRSCVYELEYGEAELEVHLDAIGAGDRILLVDDLLATGGTARAALQLILQAGAELAGALFLIELAFLDGRRNLHPHHVRSLLVF